MSKFFKVIPGYNNYLISENGEIYSKKSNKILSPGKIGRGYLKVTLWKNGKYKNFLVHRLVAMTFLDNPNNLPQINHIDGNKLNNHISNLEFCTYSQNIKHAYDHGLKENTRAAVRQNCKNAQEARKKHLDDNLKELFDDLFINKLKTKDICQKYNLKQSYVSQIKNKQKLKTAISEYQKSNLFQVWDLYFNNTK